MKGRYFFVIILAIILFVAVITDVNGSKQYWNSSKASFSVPSPINVIFQSGTQGSATFSTNNTNAQVSVAQGWLLNFQYRQQITFNNSAISQNLINFAVPIIINSSNTNFWANVQTNGNDTRFIASDNTTELYYEFEQFNHTSDNMIAWVKVPQIAASSTTSYIWLYYGNSTVNFDSYYNSSGVWDSNFAAVYHLNQTSGGPGSIKDSTSNGNNGNDSGSPTFGQPGQIGNAISFNGNSQEIQTPNSTSMQITGNITIEAWVKSVNSSQYAGIAGKMKWGSGNSYAGYAIEFYGTTHQFRFQTGNGTSTTDVLAASNSAYTDTNWHYIVGVRSGNTNYLYVDGVQQTATGNESIVDSGLIGSIGRQYSDYSGRWWNGSIDEVRISNIARSANWIKACYQYEANQSMITYGNQQAFPQPATYNYVLQVVNQVGINWTIYLSTYNSSNIGRLSNCTISFHDGSQSNQILISGGVITQSSGSQYTLPSSSTIYISISNLEASSAGTSYLYVYLRILPSNMSPFNVLHITFQVT